MSNIQEQIGNIEAAIHAMIGLLEDVIPASYAEDLHCIGMELHDMNLELNKGIDNEQNNNT